MTVKYVSVLDSQKASRLQYNVLEMSSMTIKAMLPSAGYTCHDVTYSALRNIRNLLMNSIFKAVNGFFVGVFESSSFYSHPP